MIWVSAFILGLAGSLHCAVMCGPIVSALSKQTGRKRHFLLYQLSYNLGRTITYILVGGIIGLVGKGIYLSGLQQSVSIAAGIILLVFYFSPRIFRHAKLSVLIVSFVSSITKTMAGKYFGSISMGGRFLSGMINGLLPCGLVYVAAVGAIATGSPIGGMTYMLLFGLGTFPMLLFIAYGSQTLINRIGFRKAKKIIPTMVVCISVLFILRGMNLGVKYISPQISPDNSESEIIVCE